MKIEKKLIVLVGITLLVACSSEQAGLRELRKLCEKDAGLTIYKTVQAEGYYDTTGGFDLVQSPYQFYEFCDDNPSKSRSNVLPALGCYRVEKVDRASGFCHQGYDEALRNNSFARGYSEFREKNCIAVKKIDKPTARYSYHDDISKWKGKNGKSGFIRSEVYIKDSSENKVLGRFISYSYTENPVIPESKSCDDIDTHYPSYADTNLINKIIFPIK